MLKLINMLYIFICFSINNVMEIKNNFTLNNYFENVYVINMESDKDRLNSVTNEMNKINTKFKRMPGIITDRALRKQEGSIFGKYFAPSTAFGISEAHRKIWKTIIEKDYKNALIFEDDVKFVDNIASILPKAIKELPDDWDIVYLGCLSCCDKVSLFELHEIMNPTKKKYSDNLNSGGLYYGTEAYAISYNGAKKILEQIPKINYHLDYEITYHTKDLKIFHINPPVAYQHSDGVIKSHNTNVPVILNDLLKNIKINEKCYNDVRTLDWTLSLPIFRLFSDLLTFNIWCAIFFILAFILPWTAEFLIVYIFIDIIYTKTKNLKKYIPIFVATIFGFLIRKITF